MSRLIDSKGKKYRSGISLLKEYLEINGAKQGLIIETANNDLPVLLVLHGGPGYPLYPMNKANNVELHKVFTVCYWDQRGTGMSYLSKEYKDQITLEQLTEDTIEVSKYLLSKYSKEKIYLMGHSWGTLVGSIAASKNPDLFYSYIGVGQIGYAKESERETYEFMLEKARLEGDDKAAAEIEKVGFNDLYYKNRYYNIIRGRYLNKYGGGFLKEGYSIFQNLKDVFMNRNYTLKEKINIFKGSALSSQSLSEVMATTDLTRIVTDIPIPVYIFHGKNDYMTTHTQALRFFNQLKSPRKKFFTFEHSSHAPFIEEKDRFLKLLEKEVLIDNPN